MFVLPGLRLGPTPPSPLSLASCASEYLMPLFAVKTNLSRALGNTKEKKMPFPPWAAHILRGETPNKQTQRVLLCWSRAGRPSDAWLNLAPLSSVTQGAKTGRMSGCSVNWLSTRSSKRGVLARDWGACKKDEKITWRLRHEDLITC